ncbi:trehalose-6-phosphate synthase [Leucobacter sp. GX24907]
MTTEIIIAANRLPIVWETTETGDRRMSLAPGGLVSALAPVSASLGCTWVGCLDDAPGEPFTIAGQRFVAVRTEPSQYEPYYEGFANQVLWPLFHGLPEYATHSATAGDIAFWFDAYRKVNRAFAERIARTESRDALVWVQDYHLLLLPEMLRDLRPDLRIAVFIHIPFPPPEMLEAQPWAQELMVGVGAADLIGTQREADATHLRVALEALGPHPSPDVRAFPISLHTAPVLLAARTSLEQGSAQSLRARYGASGRQMLLSVDRLDYTKGIPERIGAFKALLRSWDRADPPPVLVQVITPTRERIPTYQEYAAQVATATARVNDRYGTVGYTPIQTVTGSIGVPELADFFLAADVMCVTPLRDGMNLVAKEFATARIDESGVLVLSQTAGAADELAEAIMVDPSSPDSMTNGMRAALDMPTGGVGKRMRALRARVLGRDVHAWAREMLRACGAGDDATGQTASYEESLQAVSELADSTRHRVYDFVVAQHDAVSREHVARGLGMPLSTAKFHLERLASRGLLETESRRTTGREGPGAGRPAKHYRRSRTAFPISLPSRSYDTMGHILARSIMLSRGAKSDGSAADLDLAVRESAFLSGVEAVTGGAQPDCDADDPLSRGTAALGALGFEAEIEAGSIRLNNCPFDSLARTHREVVCSANQQYVQGALDASGCAELRAEPDSRPETCCVTARPCSQAASRSDESSR